MERRGVRDVVALPRHARARPWTGHGLAMPL